MEKAFKNEIKTRFPYLCNTKLLLAVSGGVDSVVLAHLCSVAKLDFALAHCNFNLRDEESDADEDFVADFAKKLKVKLFVENFDTEQYAKDNGLSIQMAARDLRYEWFEELRLKYQYDYTLTAHHANDSLETFFINLLRGAGLEGLSGINSDSNKIIRPLLNFSRKEIEAYAIENNISWREDSSNTSTKYLRNKIRHDIVPVFEELNPQFLETFLKTQSHLKENEELVEDYMSLLYPKIIEKTKYGYSMDIGYLKKVPNTSAVLYQLLKSFGFTEWNDVYNLLDAQPGKMVFSASHRLVKDREYLILTEKSQVEDKVYKIAEDEDFAMLPMGTFSFSEVKEIKEKASNCIYVDPEKLDYPLTVRKWQEGDLFYPFGMKGKKKLSDFFKDKKLSLPEKENSWLLCSGDKIVWVINQRADRRFSISSPDQKIIKITFSL
ncbi:tRNA(Ile)-lysidine synthetase [Salegentibacter salinarum]|uniref:tRNA(Ile)-lysidine synthase n=1 Tax=Salegentibacter salinarum TaxID=447422 RepID=A0A2N0TPH9_9FLAO|nr:tRNA lysidine(34) synthetase TilS [Salegentibacter salinarum]PKD16640.1 tRNA(Ile)-lysidine synthetase [Salegentibacter salinarum]SKB61579.1 tRNA(Ile)-lysidine synthase [Salegentibacter salinarum]